MALNNLGLGIMVNVGGNATSSLSRITSGFQSMQQAARNANNSTGGFSKSFQAIMQSDRARAGMAATGTAMLGLGATAGAGVATATMAYGDFQQQMLNVQATAGLTSDAYKDLSKFAIKLGADTKFSASQAANAIYEISSAGYSGTQQLKDMTKGSAALAAAVGTDLPTAAATMTSTMKAFQLEAGKSSHVADVLAKTASISSLKGDEFQIAFGQVAGVANMVGQSLEQTTTGLMALRNAGISASDGATSMKTALMMLINPTEEAQGWMAQLGVQVRDTQGNMKSWPDIVGEFEKAFGNVDPIMKKFQGAASMTETELKKFAATNHMTESQVGDLIKASYQGGQAFKEMAMSVVFGSDGIRAMATGLNSTTTAMRDGKEVTLTGAEAMREWENQLQNSGGTAKKMSDIMNSGINAKFEQMKGAAESAAITLGAALEPAMGAVANEIGWLFKQFSELSPGVQKFIGYALLAATALGIFGGSSLVLLSQLPQIVAGAKLARGAFLLMGGGIKSAGSSLMLGIRYLGLHAAAIAQNTFMAGLNFARWIGGMAVMGVVRMATLAWTAAQWALNVALNANPIALIVIGIAALVAGIIWAWNNVDWFRNGVISAFEWIRAAVVGTFNRVSTAISGVIKWFGSLNGWVQVAIAVFAPFIGIPLLLITHWNQIVSFFKALPGKIMGFLADLPAQALQFGTNFVNMIADGITAGIERVKKAAGNVVSGIKDFLGFGSPTKDGPGATSDQWIPNMIGMLTDGLDTGAQDVKASATGVARAAAEGIQSSRPVVTPGFDSTQLDRGLAGINVAGALPTDMKTTATAGIDTSSFKRGVTEMNATPTPRVPTAELQTTTRAGIDTSGFQAGIASMNATKATPVVPSIEFERPTITIGVDTSEFEQGIDRMTIATQNAQKAVSGVQAPTYKPTIDTTALDRAADNVRAPGVQMPAEVPERPMVKDAIDTTALQGDVKTETKVVGTSAARVAQEARAEENPERPAPQPVKPSGGKPPERPVTVPQPVIINQPAPDDGGAGVAAVQQAIAASRGNGGQQQIIQLVVDGQVLAELLAGVNRENEARSGDY